MVSLCVFILRHGTGVWVHFGADLLKDYGAFLKFSYSGALAWAYEPDLVPFPEEEIKEVLSTHKSFDFDSVCRYFHLWQNVSFKLPLPCPVLARILPATMSHWNAIKGGSDTITKLLWLNIMTHQALCLKLT